MQLNHLTLRNFRNFAALDIDLPAGGAVIVGDNGNGKTNLIEAIYYLVLFRSFRGARDRELVRFDEAGFFIAGSTDRRVTVGYETARQKKKVTVAGEEIAKLSDAVGTVTAVTFSPADRAIVEGGPAGRRRYLDIVLSLCKPGYLRTLAQLRVAMRQRNAALKRGNAEAARAFDPHFAEAAATIACARHEWAKQWRTRFIELCHELGEQTEPAWSYDSRHWTPDEGTAGVVQALATRIDRDVRRGMTTVGPHRDDLALSLGDRPLRRYGSGGQQRTAAIALRLIEAQALGEATSTTPIILFDDVFAELDQDRQHRLLTLMADSLSGQAIVTAPRDAEIPTELLGRPRWRMLRGQLEQ